jgi:hypothetical protein
VKRPYPTRQNLQAPSGRLAAKHLLAWGFRRRARKWFKRKEPTNAR